MKRPLFWILALGLLLRIWGISFGLPDLYHADEPNVVNRALAYGTGDLNPHYFKIPPLVSYLVFLTYGLYFLAARGAGWVQGVEDFQRLFFSDPTSFYLLARILFGALLGTLTVYALYRLVKKSFSRDSALLASFFLALNFLHVRDGHYVYLDMPLLLILVLSFFPILGILKEGKRGDYLKFGILAGLATAVKYNGVFIFVPFLVSHFLKTGLRPSSFLKPRLWLTGLLALGIFVLLNPFSVLDFRSFFRDVYNISEFEGFMGFTHHLTYSLPGALGFPLLTLSLLGLVKGCPEHKKERGVLASFILAYYLVLCLKSQPYDRYALPLVPFLIMLASDSLIWMRKTSRAPALLFKAMVLLVALPPLLKIYHSDVLFSKKDIRQVASEWVESHIPSNEKFALDVPFFMPRLSASLSQLEEKRNQVLSDPFPDPAKLRKVNELLEQARKETRKRRYQLYYLLKDENPKSSFIFSKPSIPYSLKALRELGINFVAVAKIKADFEPEFYSELRSEAQLLAVFNPYRDKTQQWAIDEQPLTGGPFLWRELVSRERNGQIIEVYQLHEVL